MSWYVKYGNLHSKELISAIQAQADAFLIDLYGDEEDSPELFSMEEFYRALTRVTDELKAGSGFSMSDPNEIVWGAAFRAVTKSDAELGPGDIDCSILAGLRAYTVQGGRTRVRKGKIVFGREFTEDDHKVFCAFLEGTYQESDPGWLGVLKRNIVKDLANPKVHFIIIKRFDELVALAKIRPTSKKGVWYFGSQYVKPGLRKFFGMGSFVERAAQQIRESEDRNQDHYVIQGVVTPLNPALERHFYHSNVVAKGIVRDSDKDGSSEELLTIEIDPWRTTKMQGEIPQEWIEEGVTWTKEDVVFYRFSKEDKEGYLNILSGEFRSGKIMTAFRYINDNKDVVIAFEVPEVV